MSNGADEDMIMIRSDLVLEVFGNDNKVDVICYFKKSVGKMGGHDRSCPFRNFPISAAAGV